MATKFEQIGFDHTEEMWLKYAPSISILSIAAFGVSVSDDEPLLGGVVNGTDIQMFSSLHQAFLSEETIVKLLIDPNSQELIGYSFAVPYTRFSPTETEHSGEKTAYLYDTVIKEEYRGMGLVEHLVDPLLFDLHQRGYTTLIRDINYSASKYIAAVDRRFSGVGIIQERTPHNTFGFDQVRYQIAIRPYLEKIGILDS